MEALEKEGFKTGAVVKDINGDVFRITRIACRSSNLVSEIYLYGCSHRKGGEFNLFEKPMGGVLEYTVFDEKKLLEPPCDAELALEDFQELLKRKIEDDGSYDDGENGYLRKGTIDTICTLLKEKMEETTS